MFPSPLTPMLADERQADLRSWAARRQHHRRVVPNVSLRMLSGRIRAGLDRVHLGPVHNACATC